MCILGEFFFFHLKFSFRFLIAQNQSDADHQQVILSFYKSSQDYHDGFLAKYFIDGTNELLGPSYLRESPTIQSYYLLTFCQYVRKLHF